jgi:hypothetical protein
MFYPFTNYKKVTINAAGTISPITIATTTARSLVVVEFKTNTESYSDPYQPTVFVEDGALQSLMTTIPTNVGTSAVEEIISTPTVVGAGVAIKYRGVVAFPPTTDFVSIYIFELPA